MMDAPVAVACKRATTYDAEVQFSNMQIVVSTRHPSRMQAIGAAQVVVDLCIQHMNGAAKEYLSTFKRAKP